MTSRIRNTRLLALGATALLTVGLTACGGGSTAGSGSPAAGGGTSGGAASSAASSSAAASPAGSAEELAATLVAGTSKATTTHLTLATSGGDAAAATGNGEGDVRTTDGGKTDAFTFSVGTGDTAVALVYVDGTGYVKLPASEQTDPTKPWTKVSDTSTNPVVKAISASFDQIDTQTSLTQYAALLNGATNFAATGPSEVDGTAVQGYSFDVDPASLPSAGQLGAAVSELGPIPTTMAVDSQGRPVQVVETVTVASQTITTTVTFSDYGKDADIEAPPADQVSAD